MRPVVLIVGVLIVASGIVPLTVPLYSHFTKTVSVTTPQNWFIRERFSMLADDSATAKWSSNSSVTLIVRTCSSIDASASSIWGQCTGGSNVTVVGSSGTVTRSVPVRGYLWIVVQAPVGSTVNQSATVSVTSTYQEAAIGLFGLGGVIVVVGVLLRGRKRMPRVASTPVAPAGTAGVAPPPTAGASEPIPPAPEEDFFEEPPD